MRLDYQKEKAAVFYGHLGVKILKNLNIRPNHRSFALHWNDHMELLRIHTGTMILELGKKTITVPAGQLVIVNPKQPHGGAAGPDGLCYSAVLFEVSSFINQTQANKHLLTPLVSGSAMFANITDQPLILETMDQLIAQSQTDEPHTSLIIHGKIYELMGLLYRYCLLPAMPLAICDHRFQDVLDYVNQNYCDELHSAQLSEQYGYDNAYFCRRFKAVTGLTLTRYLRILRLEHAQRLIKSQQVSLREIATLCGFTDPGYFSRCFREHYGMTPSAYAIQQDGSADTSYLE